MEIEFQWDSNKNRTNFKKHKVSFDEAKTVFYDENARLITDAEHSSFEERYVLLGISYNLRVLVVVHTYREDNNVIRIISARKAVKLEIEYYNKVK